MTVTMLAALEVVLLAGGAIAAGWLTGRLSKGGDAKVILMASVASWFVLFGMVPFLIFALFVRDAATTAQVGTIETIVLNLIPFAMVAAPLIGFGRGMRRRKQMTRP